MTELESAWESFRAELIDAGLLLDLTIPGLYAQSDDFLGIVDGIDQYVARDGVRETKRAPRTFRFPPLFARGMYEKTDYLQSFPQLTGSVHTFGGDHRDHAEMMQAHAAQEQWESWLSPAGTMLVSAACHPVYGTLTGCLASDGELIQVTGQCFRHEPSADPARMQAFRMHEVIRVGTPAQAQEHRSNWIERAKRLLGDLGLIASDVPANDPFFGRGGRLLAANQRAQNMKTEFVVRLYGDLDSGTAIASCNYHQDHFGRAFDIVTDDGEVAHSSCVGFGLERVALALLRTHGLDIADWPVEVRQRLGL